MAKLIALDWDAREARIAVGTARGNEVLVEQAFAIPLQTGEAGEAPSNEAIGQQLAAALGERGLTGNDALVAIPRSNIELRTLTLPEAPPEEIPDMVRFQAMQAFTSIGEDWPVDYVQLDSHDASISVLAAVISPKLVQQMHKICAASELKDRCLVLRPFAAVSLLHRLESIDVFRSSLMVDLLPDGADLTAISNGNVVFMRSVRLPSGGDAKTLAVSLVGELRRTIGAAQNQMGGSRIEQVIICGADTEHAVLRESVQNALKLDVITFDPFQAVRQSRSLQASLPPHAGRFAPLLGMLAAQVSETAHTLDFLNPRKRPEPPSRRNRNLAIAGAVAAVVALGSFVFLSQRSKLDQEIERLTKESTDLDQAVERARQLVAKADQIKNFESGDITWLDELREVARRMPDADHVILKEVYVGVDPVQGGRMTLRGNVSDPDVIADFEESLRYGGNRVKGYRGTIDRANRDYPYQSETTVFVPSDVLEQGRSLGRPELPEKQAAAKRATEDTKTDQTAAAEAELDSGELQESQATVDAQPVDEESTGRVQQEAASEAAAAADEDTIEGEELVDDPPEGVTRAEGDTDEQPAPEESQPEESQPEESQPEESQPEESGSEEL